MVLLEPNQKKVSFLQHAQAELELQNVTVIKGRIEDLEHLKEQLIITRAVMEPKKLLSLLPKERTSSLEILMMVSEPKELQSEDWVHKFYPSDAQRILQKNRGFLSIKNKKN
jgi:16S rRNA (guanine527-N7)-methyltransferase